MKRLLITGGSGALGNAITERVLRDGLASQVCIYSRDEHKHAAMAYKFSHHPSLRFFIGDVRERERLTWAFEGCDVVIHAAALKRVQTGIYNSDEMKKTNINGAQNVVEAARQTGVRKVVGVSSDKAFRPVTDSPYGLSKAYAESLFLSANTQIGRKPTKFSICRYGNVWKSTGSVVPLWLEQMEDGETHVRVTDPECTRFFMTLPEAVELVLNTIKEMPTSPAIPDLPAYRLGDLVEAIGAKPIVVGLPSYEKLHESMDETRCSKDARRMTVTEIKAWL